jgi:hypothetical protein
VAGCILTVDLASLTGAIGDGIAKPKSWSFTTPSPLVTMMFEGLRSRCRTRCVQQSHRRLYRGWVTGLALVAQELSSADEVRVQQATGLACVSIGWSSADGSGGREYEPVKDEL